MTICLASSARSCAGKIGATLGGVGKLAGWLRGANIEEALDLGARVGAAAVTVLGDYAGYPHEQRGD